MAYFNISYQKQWSENSGHVCRRSYSLWLFRCFHLSLSFVEHGFKVALMGGSQLGNLLSTMSTLRSNSDDSILLSESQKVANTYRTLRTDTVRVDEGDYWIKSLMSLVKQNFYPSRVRSCFHLWKRSPEPEHRQGVVGNGDIFSAIWWS